MIIKILMFVLILALSIGTLTVSAGSGAGKDGGAERPTELPVTPIPEAPPEPEPEPEPTPEPPPEPTPAPEPAAQEPPATPEEPKPETPAPVVEPITISGEIEVEATGAEEAVIEADVRVNPQTGDSFSRLGLYLSAIGLVLMSLLAFYIHFFQIRRNSRPKGH